MGDETPAESQPETQSKTPDPPIEPPKPIEPPQSKPPDPSIEPPPNDDLPHTKPTPTCKIPVRPNKLRKLSVNTRKSESPENKPENLSDADSSKTLTITPKNNRKRNPSIPPRVSPIVIKPLSAAGEIELALTHLRSADPLLVDLIDSLPPPTFDSHQSPFLALTKSILYQQLAFKAGTSIYTRFVDLCGGEPSVSPDNILSLTCPQLRQIGVSARKATYLYDLANKYKSGILSDGKIVGMDDKSLFTMLSMVKGIGSWSVHMFMIFSLHRPDVLPVSDVGVRKGVQMLYGLEELPRPSQMDKHCEKWRPYRSVGSWYMWRLVEGKGNQQAALEGIMPLQQQQEEETQQQQQQLQLQLLEPINGSANFGVAATVTAKKRRNSSISARVLPIVIKPLSDEGEMDAATRHLCAADPLFVELIDSLPPPAFNSDQSPPFPALTVPAKNSSILATVTAKNSLISARVLPIVIKSLSAKGEVDAAMRHLRSVDPLLVELIDSLPPPAFNPDQSPPFLALTKIILYQRHRFKDRTSVYTRFVELCGGEDEVLPDAVLSFSSHQLQLIGVSTPKATYLFDLAKKYKTGVLSDSKIVGMDDRSLFTKLTMVKGIGPSSVHMFMIFSLHRPDVLLVNDVDVRTGVQILNGLEELPTPSQTYKYCEKWKPYRSVGSWYMWRLVEGKGNQEAGAPMASEGIMQSQQQEDTQQQQLLEPIHGSANFG